jgi:hypothetical protein
MAHFDTALGLSDSSMALVLQARDQLGEVRIRSQFTADSFLPFLSLCALAWSSFLFLIACRQRTLPLRRATTTPKRWRCTWLRLTLTAVCPAWL